MSEEQLKELQEYNLEYLEAQESEEMFGGDYISAVELKYAKKEIERLNNIINELEDYLNERVDYMTHRSIERMVAFDCCRHKLQELKESNGAIPPEVIGTNGEDGGLFDYGDR